MPSVVQNVIIMPVVMRPARTSCAPNSTTVMGATLVSTLEAAMFSAW